MLVFARVPTASAGRAPATMTVAAASNGVSPSVSVGVQARAVPVLISCFGAGTPGAYSRLVPANQEFGVSGEALSGAGSGTVFQIRIEKLVHRGRCDLELAPAVYVDDAHGSQCADDEMAFQERHVVAEKVMIAALDLGPSAARGGNASV